MGKVVILDLEHGDFQQGFQVRLEIAADGKNAWTGESGSLPRSPEVDFNYNKWREKYRNLEAIYRLTPAKAVSDLTAEEKERRIEECRESLESLKTLLNQWLETKEFRPIERKLLTALKPSDEIRVIIRAKDSKLRQLPWDAWTFFHHFPHAAIAISPTSWDEQGSPNRKNRVKILAILGSRTGINIERDRSLLEHFPQAEVHFLVEPKLKEFELLWQDSWDILFFAGHSYSVEGKKGYICINESERLSLERLKNTLGKAIRKGLQLAIFNSCDGLGIAHEFQELNIPTMVVMREPVPDEFAQEFLKYFLESFSGGASLYTAVREAREKLHELSEIESKFPGASLLPVICQNPAVIPVKWQDFLDEEVHSNGEAIASLPPAHSIPSKGDGVELTPSLLEPEIGGMRGQPVTATPTRESPSNPSLVKPIEPSPQPPKKRSHWIILMSGFLGGTLALSAIGWWWYNRPVCSFADIRVKSKIDIPQGQRFPYGGSTTWVPLSQPVHEAIKKTLPEFDLDTPKYPGSVEGIQQLLGGYFAFSLSSTHLQKQDLTQAQQQNYELMQKPVGIDAIAVGVNPQLGISSLTLVQLKDIYTGKIRNWQQVGGPDLPITPYSRKLTEGGSVRFFMDAVLGGQSFNPQVVKFVDSTTTGIRQVSHDLGGIYYASAPELVHQCGIRPLPLGLQQNNAVPPYQGDLVPPESCPQQRNEINREVFRTGEYPLTRNLYVIIKDFPGNNNPQEKAGRAYADLMLTGRGQTIVKESGFVPVRDTCPSP